MGVCERHCACFGTMHRRAQKAESEVAKLTRQLANARPDPWKSEGRKREAIERDRLAAVIERADQVTQKVREE